MSAKSIIPAHYDIEFLEERANTTFYGVKKNADTYELVYEDDKFDVVNDLIASYDVDYLDVAGPNKIQEIVNLRKEKIKQFTFGALTLELDHVTETRLTAAVLYLMRNEDVLALNWDVGVGEFLTIPRDTILEMGDAAAAYMQGCFDRSKELVDAVNASTNIDDLDEIDIESGWPDDYVSA